MKLLLVTSIFPPDIGGPATFIDTLGGALVRKGHKVTVVCASKKSTEATDALRPFRVVRIATSNRIRFEVVLRAVLAREMFRNNLILANGLYEYVSQVATKLGRRYVVKIVGDYAWEMARNMGITNLSIDDFQGQDISDAYISRLRRNRDNYLRYATKIIVPSDYLNRMVNGWGVPEGKIITVLNGVALDSFIGSPPTPRSNVEPMNVVFVGRLTNWKGAETLLLSINQTRGIHLTIVGDGPEMPMLTTLTAQLGLSECVRFAGRLAPDAVRLAFSRAHALALPSLYEGLSHTLLEACAMGLPCIASNCGGNTEIITDGENGILVPYGNVGAMQQALEILRDNEQVRLRLGMKAMSTATTFSFENTMTRTVDALCD